MSVGEMHRRLFFFKEYTMFFEKSETVGELAKALSKVQAALRPAIKDSSNPFFKSKYADLNSVWDSCRELLASNELSVTQLPSGDDENVIVTTMLMHSSGEWVSSATRARPKASDPQAIGSAITYLRRYGLAAVVGIVADEDDDGNAATHPARQGQQQNYKPQQQAKQAEASTGELDVRAEAHALAKRIGCSDENLLKAISGKFNVGDASNVKTALARLGDGEVSQIIDLLNSKAKEKGRA